MKTLFILRHAKSSWKDAGLADFERPLNARGLDEAAFMGNWIYKNQIQPDLIISSPAKRTKQTAILVRETAQLAAQIRYEERVYEASPLTLLEIVSEASDENETLMLVGHNPGLEGLIKVLTGEDLALPTAGFVKINLKIEKWSELVAGAGHLELLMCPNEKIKTFQAG